MREKALDYEQTARPPLSIATYVAILATLLIMVLSAITFAVTPENSPVRPANDPSVSLIGFTDAE